MSSAISTTNKQTHTQIKGLAILAVVLIHSLSLFPDTIYTASPYSLLFLTLNQAARFSVPIFLVLSGYGLTQKYAHQAPTFLKFMSQTLTKLLPLYLIWSIVLIAILKSGVSPLDSKFWQYLVQGKADYHLYFVPLILQLYAVFFLLHSRLNRTHLFAALLVTGTIQSIWLIFVRASLLGQATLPISASDQTQYRLIFNWAFYFLLGMFISRLDLTAIRARFKIAPILISFTLAGLVWTIIDSLELIHLTHNITFATSFTRLPVLFYATSFSILTLVYSSTIFSTRIFNSKFYTLLGRHSFSIYLTHTLALRIIDSLITGQSEVSFIAITTSILSQASINFLSSG